MLRSGYFSDFKGGPKLLFWGNQRAMSQLANLLRAGSVGTGPLGLGSFSEAVDGKAVVLQKASRSTGLRSVGSYFEWSLSTEDMGEFAERVDALVEANGPAHQYLECGVDNEITVMVSKDEYPPELRP